MSDLIIRDVDWWRGVSAAKQFVKDYPEGRNGVRNCVIYSTNWDNQNIDVIAIYRTKTAIVVRGQRKEAPND